MTSSIKWYDYNIITTQMSYTYSQLKLDVTNRLHNKIGRITSPRDAINSGVRNVVGTPLKTLVRRFSEPIRIMEGVQDYTCPSDIQGAKVIDLKPISESRSNKYAWRNTHPEAFDRLKDASPTLCVTNNGQIRVLKASAITGDVQLVVSEMDSITDGGTWAVIGTASNLATDTSTYLYGNGSIRFDIGAGLTDGIDVALTVPTDISAYQPDGSAYLSVSLPTVSGLTSIIVRIGSDNANYIQLTATTDLSGNALTTGWNLLKFKLSDATTVGAPDLANIDYVAVLVSKDATAYTGVRVDRLIVGNGTQHELTYYSRFGWRSAAGAWKADSTLDTDILNAEEEEYALVVESCLEQCALAAREYQDADRATAKLREIKREYQLANPDRSIILSSDQWLSSSR